MSRVIISQGKHEYLFNTIYQVYKAIWGKPGKNNNDENNNDATFLAKLFRSLFYQKMEWTKWLQLGRGASNTMSNNSYVF